MQALIVILINEDMLCICIYEVDPCAHKTFMRVSVERGKTTTIISHRGKP